MGRSVEKKKNLILLFFLPACNTGHVLSGTACVSTASTTTTTAAAKTTTTASSASTSSAGLPKAWKGTSTFTRAGYTGVGAMQVALVDVRARSFILFAHLVTFVLFRPFDPNSCFLLQDDHLLIYDKAENNALLDASGDPAWSALYSISEKKVRRICFSLASGAELDISPHRFAL